MIAIAARRRRASALRGPRYAPSVEVESGHRNELASEVRERLFARVYAAEPGIVVYREIAYYNAQTIELMTSHVVTLARSWSRFVAIVDLREVGLQRPTAEARVILRRRLTALRPRMAVLLVVTDNLVMKVACRFLSFAADIRLEFCADDAAGVARGRVVLGLQRDMS